MPKYYFDIMGRTSVTRAKSLKVEAPTREEAIEEAERLVSENKVTFNDLPVIDQETDKMWIEGGFDIETTADGREAILVPIGVETTAMRIDNRKLYGVSDS